MNLSAPQLISPLLDGFVMGDPISNHDGVRACPAMQLETDKKYIVKIISLPANQSKLDALLLAGAYSDRESALEYFKELADGVLAENELLQKLSNHEGFIPFENWQMIPMEDDETGYDIYLLSPYRPTLSDVLRTNEMTHLQAVNLGLDLCSALSASRRMGYLFCNLKPSNIYICNDREFRIGDLGFLSLDSLQYASLPEKYHSDYTPVEISDAYSALNSTMDTYAVGLILYQAYNDGRLPPVGIQLEAPRYADAALSEIILKACALDPADRWQDPVQMGQALAAYMQSNTVNDIPIVPVLPVEDAPVAEEVISMEDSEPSTDDILAEVDQALEAAPPIPEPVEKPVEETVVAQEPEEDATEAEITEEINSVAEDVSTVDSVEEIVEESAEPVIDEDCEDAEPACEDAAVSEESEESEEDTTETVLDETAMILAQADDLIAHQLPDPPVAPDPIEVTLPDPAEIVIEVPEEPVSENELPEEEFVEGESEDSASDESENDVEEEIEAEEEYEEEEEIAQPTKKRKSLIVLAIVLSAILVLSVAAFVFYQNFYLQTIQKIDLVGTEDKLTVTLTTDIADEKLLVKCSDISGNALTAEVVDGVANFVGLRPGTYYKIEVRIDGFHKLVGQTTQVYTTAKQIVITGFYAVTGPEDGSVILSFSTQGPESSQWVVTYYTEGEPEKSITFTGNKVPVNGLTVGKEYTFTLKPVVDTSVSGTDTIRHIASKLVYAQNVKVLSFIDGSLSLTWDAPEGTTVSKWNVHCTNELGFDKTLTTQENSITIDGLDPSCGYSIEITAEGMNKGTRIDIVANSITLTNISTDTSDRNNLKISWEHTGNAPEGGWLLYYTVDGIPEQQVITCTENFGTITSLIPGVQYTITIQAANSTAVYGNQLIYDVPSAPPFNGFDVTADNMEFSMCKTPNKANWTRKDVPSGDYVTSFHVGTSASFVMHLNKRTTKTDDMITTLYVIRDLDGKLVSVNTESRTWDEMWNDRYGELTIPVMPELAGHYTVEIYFNGTAAHVQRFTVHIEA